MIDKNQEVEVSWNNYTKKWYKDKGYEFTKIRSKFNVKVKDLMPASTVKISVICDYCGIEKTIPYSSYQTSTKQETQKYACKNCGRLKTEDYRTDKVDLFNDFLYYCELYGYTPISKLADYKNMWTKLKFICHKHGEQEMTLASLKAGCKCNLCGFESSAKKNSRTIDDVRKIVESKNNNILLNPDEYINTKTNNLKIICGSCGKEFTTSLASIMGSEGHCYECGVKKSSNSHRLTSEKIENIVNSVNGNILLNPEEYQNNSVCNLRIKCGQCGDVFVTSLVNYTYFECNRCNKCSGRQSKGEIAVINTLNDLKIEYELEKHFSNCKYKKELPFDFYLPKYNTCIEFDGQQHYFPIYGEEALEIVQLRDNIKTDFCKNNNIKLIRIPYWEGNHIKNILIRELNLQQIA